MGRYTPAYSEFLNRLQEIQVLQKLAEQTAGQLPIPENVAQINALCRSGVVLLSSHIEGFIKQLAEIALDRIGIRNLPKSSLSPKFKFYLSRDKIKSIKDSTDPLKVAAHLEAMWLRDINIWDSSLNFTGPFQPTIFIGDFSNPSHSKISEFFKRFGYDQFELDLSRRLRADYMPCKNMVDQVITQRNRIAHGDMVTIGTPTDLAQMIQLTKQYCRDADCIVANWFRSVGCSIR